MTTARATAGEFRFSSYLLIVSLAAAGCAEMETAAPLPLIPRDRGPEAPLPLITRDRTAEVG